MHLEQVIGGHHGGLISCLTCTAALLLCHPWLLLLASVALTVAIGLLAIGWARCPETGCGVDAAKQSLTGVQLGQAVVAVLAVLVVGGEYSTGMMRTTLLAVPSRGTVLLAKATIVVGVVLAAGTVAVLGCVLAGRLILPGHGFTAVHGYPPLSLMDGAMLRAAGGSVLYLGLIGLLALGVATAIRDSAASVGVVLGLLYLWPIIAHMVTSVRWQRHLEQAGPSTAGLSIQATRLAEVRNERRPNSQYASLKQCRHEVASAERLMRMEGIPWLSTTTKSIEEISTKVLEEVGLNRRAY